MKDDGKFNNRADVYAVGVILYEMCSKEFEGPINIDDVEEHVDRLGYSEDLVTILTMLLNPDGNDRKSMIEIIKESPFRNLLKLMRQTVND